MSREDLYDEEGDGEVQPYFVIERPLDELPTFQAHIYRLYSPISVQERVVTDDISHRMYYGLCSHCSEEHYLGTLVMSCHEPTKLYARIK